MLKVHQQNGCNRDGDGDFSRCPIIDFNTDSPSLLTDFSNFFKQIANGQKALLTESVVFRAIKDAGCALEPRIIQGIRLSEKSFATDMVTLVMRSDLPLAFREYYEYRTRSLYLEAGVHILRAQNALREETIAKLGDKYDWKFEKCLIGIFDNDSMNDEHDLIQLPLKSLHTLANITLVLLIGSIVLLISEVIHFLILRIWKKTKVLNRPMLVKQWINVQPTEFYLSSRDVWH